MATATSRQAGIKLSVDDLRKALRVIDPAVPARSPKPVLMNVFIADGAVTATDLELKITAPLPGAGEPCLLPYERLRSIVNNVTGDTMTLRIEGSSCVISAAGGRWALPTADVSEFPAAAQKPTRPIARLPGDQLAMLLTPVLPAASKSEGRYGGVQVEFVGGTLFLVATDGRRLAVSEADIDQATDDASAYVPRRAAEAILRAAAGCETAQLETTGSELVATLDGVVITARLLEESFPKWRKIEKESDVPPTFANAGDLLHCCTLASVCASEQSRGVRWTISEKRITLSAKSAEYGESVATCDVGEAGHACSFTINPQYAAEWLSRVDAAEMIAVEAKDSGSAVLLRSETSRITIMPLSA